jgi:hypothetical protein
MLFPVIRIRDKGSKDKGFMVGTNSHHRLELDGQGNIKFFNLQCCDGTGKYGDYEFVTEKGSRYIEMVTFDELLAIYKEEINMSCETEAEIKRIFDQFRDEAIKKNGLEEEDFNNTGGILI